MEKMNNTMQAILCAGETLALVHDELGDKAINSLKTACMQLVESMDDPEYNQVDSNTVISAIVTVLEGATLEGFHTDDDSANRKIILRNELPGVFVWDATTLEFKHQDYAVAMGLEAATITSTMVQEQPEA